MIRRATLRRNRQEVMLGRLHLSVFALAGHVSTLAEQLLQKSPHLSFWRGSSTFFYFFIIIIYLFFTNCCKELLSQTVWYYEIMGASQHNGGEWFRSPYFKKKNLQIHNTANYNMLLWTSCREEPSGPSGKFSKRRMKRKRRSRRRWMRRWTWKRG